MNQRTLNQICRFEGKGLHSGRYVHMELRPAPVDTGIVFFRSDLEIPVKAVAENVSSTARSTTIAVGDASISTIEHVMSAMYGLGIDNVTIAVDGPEVPILDGSALPYVEAALACGILEQDKPRRWIELPAPLEYRNEKTGSWIRVTPSQQPSFDVTIDFNSKVLGVQKVHWDLFCDYSTMVAPCRTFVFLHEIRILAALGLVKGGDVENAIVVVEKPVGERALARMSRRFNQPRLSVTPEGYLSNVSLRFPDECGRHKLLDVIGDLSLAGGYVNARVEAYKPGHSVNTQTAKLIRQSII